jgi:hypothetical protein
MTRAQQAVVVLLVFGFAVAVPSAAFGYNENMHIAGGGCGGDCHTTITINETNCARCHTFAPDNTNFAGSGGDPNTLPDFPLLGEYAQKGPHGVYKTTTNRCSMCHTLHDAPTGFSLLPGNTVKDTCFTCHDGTGGFGVYGTIEKRTGAPAAGGHTIESTNVVPGGDAATGGSSTAVSFRGTSGNLTCSDCHSPHDSNTVAPFTGERVRIRAHEAPVYSTKLLKQQPTGAATATSVYGSDWCAGCHAGRTSGATVHNHPVETKATRPADFYYYNNLAVYRTAGFPTDGLYESGALVPLNNTYARMGAVGNLYVRGNGTHPTNASPVWAEADFHSSPWLMAYPRSPLHAGHAPICQQCHEDARECGELSADGTTVSIVRDAVWGTDADGLSLEAGTIENPRFQNFPHETQNAAMLVETGDDLCLNCHPTGQLP